MATRKRTGGVTDLVEIDGVWVPKSGPPATTTAKAKRKQHKAVNLTDLYLKNLHRHLEVGEYVRDLTQRHLYVFRLQNGHSFRVLYRFNGKPSPALVLQSGIGLAQARKLTADAMFLVAQGKDPRAERKAERERAIMANEGTVAALCGRWLELVASKFRSKRHYELVIQNNILPKLGARSVLELKRSEIVAAFDVVEAKAGPRAADMALSVLNQILRWHERRHDTFRSPIISGMRRARYVPRKRSLSDDEIKAIWIASGDERMGMFGQAIRLMLLTGGRRSEIAGIRRSEIEDVRDNGDVFRCWRLPARRSKNKNEVIRPLSRAALDIIDNVLVIGSGDGDLVFSLDGMKPMTLRFRKKEDDLDRLSGTSDWTLHDARRTFRSLLSRLRVPSEIAERLLGHTMPTLIEAYDQHSHLPAMAEAANKLAAEIARIVEGERKGKVVRLR
jgi:integrase